MTDATATADAPQLEAFGYKQELKRSLSLFDLLVYGLVFIAPGAPVPVFGIVFNSSKGMVPLVYLIGLVAMIFTALSYTAMARAYPVAGSVYSYATRSIGEAAGFIAGWALLLDYVLMPALGYIVCAIALHAILPVVPEFIWVAGLVAFSTAINYFGIETTARANFALLILQLAITALFTIMALIGLARGVGGAHLSFTPLFNPHVLTPGLVFGALSLAVLSFLGFDGITTLSEEASGGAKAIGRATILSLCVCAFLFVAQTYVASLFVLGRTSLPHGAATDEAFYGISAMLGGAWLKWIVAIPGVVIGAAASTLCAQAATARLIFSMARDGKLPRTLAHVNPRRKVPERAVFLVAAVTLILGSFMLSRFELLTSMVSFGALVGFLMLHFSVLAHFGKQRSRNWWRHYLVPVIGLIIIGYVLWNAEANAKIIGTIWLTFGVVLYVSLKAMGRTAAVPIS